MPTLYNGISLPDEWPPRDIDTGSRDPLPVPYLQAPPAVIPIDVGRQLFVDDFLIRRTDLARAPARNRAGDESGVVPGGRPVRRRQLPSCLRGQHAPSSYLGGRRRPGVPRRPARAAPVPAARGPALFILGQPKGVGHQPRLRGRRRAGVVRTAGSVSERCFRLENER